MVVLDTIGVGTQGGSQDQGEYCYGSRYEFCHRFDSIKWMSGRKDPRDRKDSLWVPHPKEDPVTEVTDHVRQQRGSDELRRHIPWWWPMVPQVFGMAVIGYETLFDSLDRPYVLAAGLALALGGKFADALRNVL